MKSSLFNLLVLDVLKHQKRRTIPFFGVCLCLFLLLGALPILKNFLRRLYAAARFGQLRKLGRTGDGFVFAA